MTDDEREAARPCGTNHPLPCRIDQDCEFPVGISVEAAKEFIAEEVEYAPDDPDDFEIGSPADGDVIETKEFDADLATALDGLQDAEKYCETVGLDDLAEQCAELYQAVGQESPDWGDGGD